MIYVTTNICSFKDMRNSPTNNKRVMFAQNISFAYVYIRKCGNARDYRDTNKQSL